MMTYRCNGKLFADIPFSRRCKAYLGDNNKMLEYIKRLRNEKVHELMLEAANRPGNRDTLLWKRELCGLIPPIITVNVVTASSMVVSVNVMTSWRTSAVLKLEAKPRNIELLLEEPPAGAAESAPCAWTKHEHKNVHWDASRRTLRIHWWDSKLKKWNRKQMRVTIDDNVVDSDKHDGVMKVAAVLQAFYDSNHSPEKNMYSRKRKRVDQRKRDRRRTP